MDVCLDSARGAQCAERSGTLNVSRCSSSRGGVGKGNRQCTCTGPLWVLARAFAHCSQEAHAKHRRAVFAVFGSGSSASGALGRAAHCSACADDRAVGRNSLTATAVTDGPATKVLKCQRVMQDHLEHGPSDVHSICHH